MGVGLVLIAFIPTLWIRLSRSLHDVRPVLVLLPAALVPIVLSTGALDLPRLSSPATPVLGVVLALFLVTAATRLQAMLIVALGLVFLWEWDVFGAIARTQRGYTNYYLARGAFGGGVLALLLVLAAALVAADVAQLGARRARGATRSPSR